MTVSVKIKSNPIIHVPCDFECWLNLSGMFVIECVLSSVSIIFYGKIQ